MRSLGAQIICFGSDAYSEFVLVVDDSSAGFIIKRPFARCPECNEWFEYGRFGYPTSSGQIPRHYYDMERGSHPFRDRPDFELAIDLLRRKEATEALKKVGLL